MLLVAHSPHLQAEVVLQARDSVQHILAVQVPKSPPKRLLRELQEVEVQQQGLNL